MIQDALRVNQLAADSKRDVWLPDLSEAGRETGVNGTKKYAGTEGHGTKQEGAASFLTSRHFVHLVYTRAAQ